MYHPLRRAARSFGHSVSSSTALPPSNGVHLAEFHPLSRMSCWQTLPRFSSIANFVKSGHLCPTVFGCNKLVEAYSKLGRVAEARALFVGMPEKNVFTWNTMIHGCIRNNDMESAHSLFQSSPEKDSVTYNSMISGFASEFCDYQAIDLFHEMRRSGLQADGFVLPTMLNVAARQCDVEYGTQIHACMIKTASDSDDFGVSSLIDMYSKCGLFGHALLVNETSRDNDRVVDSVSRNALVAACCRDGEIQMALDLFSGAPIAVNDVVCWNTIICGCAQNGLPETALQMFAKMSCAGVSYNEYTVVGILVACTDLKSLLHGKQVHSLILRKGLDMNSFVSSCLVDCYCKCGQIRYAEAVFSANCSGNLFSATSMIQVHSQRGNLEEARRLFNSLEENTSVAWTALFSGYINSGLINEVFDLFKESAFQGDPLVRDSAILIHVLGCGTVRTDLLAGKQVHAYVLRIGNDIEKTLGCALVDMYAKCGEVGYADKVFQEVPRKDRALYNALMSGFAHSGRADDCIQLFEAMLLAGHRPDEVSFIALLSACRHAGLVERGEQLFNSMTAEYRIIPEKDHYSSMIDLLGRANQLDKALSLIRSLPYDPDAVVWGTFLNACRINRNTDLARVAEEKLLKLESGDASRYVQLANIFAAKGEWAEVERIRKKMRTGDAKKLIGCSWIQMGKMVHAFASGDRSHMQSRSIYGVLENLYLDITEVVEVFTEYD